MIDKMKCNELPLVSVIIPTYCRPEYFELALKSVLNQTYKNIDIFITDNSPDTRTRDLMQSYLKKYPNIKYEHHPEYDAKGNWNRAFAYDNPKAEYVNWLMDDDIFMPNKIEYMVDKFLKIKGLSLVTSYRQRIDEMGNIRPDLHETKPIAQSDTIFLGKTIGKTILATQCNFVGEPTTVLIKKSFLKNGTLGGCTPDDVHFVSDFPTWLYCLKNSNMYYVAEPLSQFRVHAGQEQNGIDCVGNGVCKWAMETLYEFDHRNYFDSTEDLLNASKNWFEQLEYYVNRLEKLKGFNSAIAEDVIKYAEKMIEYRETFYKAKRGQF